MSRTVTIQFRFGTRSARAGLTAVLLVSSALPIGSETLTLSTYYPAPLGVYREVVTTGQGTKHTLLVRDDANAYVGVGTASPDKKLDVNGTARLRGGELFFGGGSYGKLSGSSSALGWLSDHDTSSALEMKDRQNTYYGALYGDGDGDKFGLLDGGGRWAVYVDNNDTTQLLVANTWRLKAHNSGVDVNGDVSANRISGSKLYLSFDGAGCTTKSENQADCTSGYSTWVPGIYARGNWRQDRHAAKRTNTMGGEIKFYTLKSCADDPADCGWKGRNYDQVVDLYQATWYCCPW